nr:hypothetical protein [uncultured Desulfobulbus sp.]
MSKGTKAIYRIMNDDGEDVDVFTIQYDPESGFFFINILLSEYSDLPKSKIERFNSYERILEFFENNGPYYNYHLDQIVDFKRYDNLGVFIETFAEYYSTVRSGLSIIKEYEVPKKIPLKMYQHNYIVYN